ncbi:alpha/beta-hydrolase [Atractiella rhizophila]|nr:alpha/beta-hydrolase [Atractiella rhizophila]
MGAKEPSPIAFYSTARGKSGPVKPLVKKRQHLKVWWIQARSFVISTFFLIFIVIWALSSRFLSWSFEKTVSFLSPFAWWDWILGKGKKEVPEWERIAKKKYANEKCTNSVRYYAQNCGYDIEEQTITTEDGYHLRIHRVIVPGRESVDARGDGKGGWPVLIQHGLFQSSGSFITSEERSLAFWLASKGGYQVYLSNSRGVFGMGHESIRREDPRFWDYNIKELAIYDLPAVVEHVKKETGYEKVAFIGHSQGNATMFCSLATGMVPSLGSSLSVFVALAPAVYAGPLTSGFPFGALKSMKWTTWRRVFGVLDFIPLMRIAYDYTPSKPFGLLGYQMFAFLFNWTDKNWLERRKAKKFRFTPTPVSSAGIFWWTGFEGFSTRGCVLDPAVDKWWDENFPPLSIYYGGMDYLVRTEPLLERLKNTELDVDLIRVDRMDDGEHCDFFWSVISTSFDP